MRIIRRIINRGPVVEGRRRVSESQLVSQFAQRQMDLSVDLGSGRFPRNPFQAKNLFGVDLAESDPRQTHVVNSAYRYLRVSVGGRLPFPDSSVDAVTAFDFFEHLPRSVMLLSVDGSPPKEGLRNLFIESLNEIHRILKPGGVLLGVTPAYPSAGAFVDPTHVNFITEDSHKYFSGDSWARVLGYGFEGSFDVVQVKWLSHRSPLLDHSSSAIYVSTTRRVSLGLEDFFAHLRRRPMRRSHLMWLLQKS